MNLDANDDDSPLHDAIEADESAETVAELARCVADVDVMCDGRTALWEAVARNRPDTARVLVAAGADPLRDMMFGWSPARLSLAGPTPDLFGSSGSLTPEETGAVKESRRLVAAVGNPDGFGDSIACVSGISAVEAIRRLDAQVREGDHEELLEQRARADWDDPEWRLTLWVTDVPGGCVLTQQQDFVAQSPRVLHRLSAGTTCYGMYSNPKSGSQGSVVRDGQVLGWDLSPGCLPCEDEEIADVLLSYLYQGNEFAYCLAYAGLRPDDDRSLVGPPDHWIHIPDTDQWSTS